MSPASKRYVITDLLLWVALYGLWILVFQNHTITITRTMGIEFCYLVFIALNFYVTVYYLIPQFLSKKKYLPFISGVIVFTAFAAVLRSVVAYYITQYTSPDTIVKLWPLYSNSLLNIFIWTELLVAGKLMLDKIRAQRYTETLEKEKIKTELDFLKAQYDPHFLFNSLNSLYFQIDKGNKDARTTLMKLSEMLRYQLYESSSEKIPIDKELLFLKNYIELQRIRLNDNYKITFDVGREVNGFEIAPLLIIPLIENAFKHVSHYTDKSNEIGITLNANAGAFTCTVVNTLEQNKENSNGGIGLKNLERRLELIYPGKHELRVSNGGATYSATLKIPTNEN